MNIFGGKPVIGTTEFVEGTIIEYRNGKLVARDYYKREDGELEAENGSYELDFVVIYGKQGEYEKTKEIENQLGSSNFYISEEVVEFIK